MKFFNALAERRSSEQTFSLRDPALADFFGMGSRSISGPSITPENSLRVSGWFACVRIIASAVAKTPFITYSRLDGGGKERATDHPVYAILHDQPNPFMSPMEYFKACQAHVLNWGNSFSLVERDGAGRALALWPMHPARVRVQVTPSRIWYYHYGEGGREQQFPMDSVLHVRGLSSDGVLGYCQVDLQREALGLAKAEEEYRARFFKNDARPGAIIEYPGEMSDDAYKRFKSDWQDLYGGLGNRHKVGFLEQGLKWHEVGVPPQTAQFLEGRKFQLEELARITGVPLVLLQSTEKATSWGSGIAEILRAFLENCLLDWFIEWEQRAKLALFTPSERRKYFAEHELKNFLRGDPKAEAEVLQIMRRNGALNVDEWRNIVNMNPLPDKQGQIYIVEGNMTRLDQVGRQNPAPEGGAEG
jgi:HK97 family phage portal protein